LDGKLDLAVATAPTSPGTNNISVLLGNGNGTFQTAVQYAVDSYPYSVTAGDFNGDNRPDLAVATDIGVSLLPGIGDGTFKTAVSYGAGNSPNFVASGDFNSDGRLDLVVADTASASICVLLSKTDATLRAPVNYSAGWVPLSMAAA